MVYEHVVMWVGMSACGWVCPFACSWRPEEDIRCTLAFHPMLTPLRQDPSLDPKLGWQPVRCSNPVSATHGAGGKGDASHSQLDLNAVPYMWTASTLILALSPASLFYSLLNIIGKEKLRQDCLSKPQN